MSVLAPTKASDTATRRWDDQRLRRLLGRTGLYVAALALGLFSAFPFFWMILTSVKPRAEILTRVPVFWPSDPSLERYVNILTGGFTLGELHDLIASFRANRGQSVLPDLSHPLTRALYSTYVSFYDAQNLAYPVTLKTDERGWLFEFVKSPCAGQIFVSRTKPGITRGNHILYAVYAAGGNYIQSTDISQSAGG